LDTQQKFVLIAATMYVNPVKLVLQGHGSRSEQIALVELWESSQRKQNIPLRE